MVDSQCEPFYHRDMSSELTVDPIQVARVISALLAAGILQMRGIAGEPGWFWLFLLEGLLTVVIGAIVCPWPLSFCYRDWDSSLTLLV